MSVPDIAYQARRPIAPAAASGTMASSWSIVKCHCATAVLKCNRAVQEQYCTLTAQYQTSPLTLQKNIMKQLPVTGIKPRVPTTSLLPPSFPPPLLPRAENECERCSCDISDPSLTRPGSTYATSVPDSA
eukprot:451466-Rhodomonas_salina.2